VDGLRAAIDLDAAFALLEPEPEAESEPDPESEAEVDTDAGPEESLPPESEQRPEGSDER